MFRCYKAYKNPIISIQKLFTRDVGSAQKINGIKLNQQSHRLKSTNTVYSQKLSGNLGSGLCILGGTVFLSIGFYKYLQQHQVKAAETQQQETVDVTIEHDSSVRTTCAEDCTEAKEAEPVVFPEEVQYLLIGGGTASYSAMRAIRKKDVTAKVLIITDEDQVPYMRPPLSKELWFSEDRVAAQNFEFKQWNGKPRNIFFEKKSFYCKPSDLEKKEGGVAIALKKRVMSLDSACNTATLQDGTKIKYEKCLIATGGDPKNLPSVKKAGAAVLKRTTLYRKTSDFLELDRVTDNDDVKSVTVIGGGFMGSEIACALGHKGKKKGFEVNQVFPEHGNMGLVLPEYLTKWTTEKVKGEGVNVITKAMVKDVQMKGCQVKLTTQDNREILTDHLVVAVGLDIDTSLAPSAGIEVDDKLGGYRVNTELQARSNIWVAGDASCFYDAKLGRRRVEHHDHAVVSGRLAGENMTGCKKPYFHQSMFWSDLGPDVGYEAIGLVDSKLPTVGVFAKATEKDTPRAAAQEGLRLAEKDEPQCKSDSDVYSSKLHAPTEKEEFGKGVIFYLRDEKVVGLLLWNVFGRMPIARKIIQDQQSYDDFGEVAKVFKIHSEELD